MVDVSKSIICGIFLLSWLSGPVKAGGECGDSSQCENGGRCYGYYCGCAGGHCGFLCKDAPALCKTKHSNLVEDCKAGFWVQDKCTCLSDYGLDSKGECTVKGASPCNPPCTSTEICKLNWRDEYKCIECMGTEEECKASCPSRTAPLNGEVAQPDNPTSGEVAEFSCHAGYTLKGESVLRCSLSGDWSDKDPTCVGQCTVDQHILNGGYSPEQDYYATDDVITFVCDEGYCLDGISSTKCSGSGEWDQKEFPTCHLGCKRPNVVNGGVVDGKPSYCQGEQITYSCDSGFGHTGDDDAKCLDGGWSNTVICEPFCPSRTPPLNGDVAQPANPMSGDVAEFSCHAGYTLKGESVLRCTASGVWSDKDPTCVKQCTIDKHILNGGYSPAQDYYASNDVITFECDEGYCLDGISSTQCSESGEWDQKEFPTCHLGCKRPIVVNGGVVDGKPTYCQGEKIMYSCDSGFGHTGDYDAQCLDGGWSNTVNCKPTDELCARPGIANGGVVPDHFWYDPRTFVDFYCDDGYTLRGRPRAGCSKTKKWKRLPVCTAFHGRGNCKQRCGAFDLRPTCQCHYLCMSFGTCCSDFERRCFGKSKRRRNKYKDRDTDDDTDEDTDDDTDDEEENGYD